MDRVTSYTYKVAAINSAGIGTNSNTATLATAAELPGPPTGLTLTAGSPANTAINLAWTAPTDTGGGAITGYRMGTDAGINKTGANQQYLNVVTFVLSPKSVIKAM